MFDTHAIARALADADLTPAQVNAITDAVRRAADHGEGDLVARAELRAEFVSLELRLVKWNVGSALAGAGIVIAGRRLIG